MKKTSKLHLMAMIVAIFTGTNQVSFALEEDTVFNSATGFIKNMGQLLDTNREVTHEPLYYAPAGNLAYYLLANKIAYVFKQDIDNTDEDSLWRMDLTFVDGNAEPEMREINQISYNNYYLDYTGANGIDSVGIFESVDYDSIFNNIDLNCNTTNGLQLKFTVAAGTSTDDIKFYFDGADSTLLYDGDSLNIYCPLGIVIFDSLYAYQVINNEEVPVDIEFNLDANDRIVFNLGNYSDSYALIIIIGSKPAKGTRTLQYWSTILRGAGVDENNDVWIDANNKVYCTGTCGPDPLFPVGGGGQYTTYDPTYSNAFVLKFGSYPAVNPVTDRHRLWGSYFGGSLNDYGMQVIVNSSGYVYITGYTQSSDAPMCTSCTTIDPLLEEDTYQGGPYDIFIVKFNSDGKIYGFGVTNTFATYYGGDGTEQPLSMTIDGNNNVYIGGYVEEGSYDGCTDCFPAVTFSGAYNQAFSANNDGVSDAFIIRISMDAINRDSVFWSTAVGGNNLGTNNIEAVTGLITDVDNDLYATGLTTCSADIANAVSPLAGNSAIPGYFPATDPNAGTTFTMDQSGGYDAFVIKFDFLNNGGKIEWATLFGGTADENKVGSFGSSSLVNEGGGIAVDADKNIFITGTAFSSSGFPIEELQGVTGAYNEDSINLGQTNNYHDAFIAWFEPDFSLNWSTYYGGSDEDYGIQVAYARYPSESAPGLLYFTGNAGSNFPLLTVSGSYNQSSTGSRDAYILKFTTSGVRRYSMWYGGSGGESSHSIATDLAGTNVLICGQTAWASAPIFPLANPTPGNLTNGAYFYSTPQIWDAFISNLKNLCNPCARIGKENFNSNTDGYILYPNPASQYIKIASDNKITVATIYNSMGAKAKGYLNENNEIYVGELPSGLYLLKTQDNIGKIKTLKFIVE